MTSIPVLRPVTRRVARLSVLPDETAQTAVVVRCALLETLARYRRELQAAERHLGDAIEADAGELIAWHTESVSRLRTDIRLLAEYLEAL